MITISVDLNLCQSHGACVISAPEIFQLGDDDRLRWLESVDESRRTQLEEAVDVCPMMAIRLEG